MGNFFNCYLWWLLFGVVLGVIAYWLFTLLLRHGQKTSTDDKLTQLNQLTHTQQTEIANLQAKLAAVNSSETGISTATSLGFTPLVKGEDNLKIVEGIGPKISTLLKQNNITTFEILSQTPVQQLQKILADAGPAYKLAKPESWPKQAAMCFSQDWQTLKEYQDRLVGGIELDK